MSISKKKTKKKNQYKSISQITQEISNSLRDCCQNTFFIKGEVTNYRNPKFNGNLYFDLRDEEDNTTISCMSWYSTRKGFPVIKNGDIVKIICKLTHYEQKNTISLLVQGIKICKKEESNFYIQYKELESKYEKLGYFDDDKKKKIKENNKRIGIITARHGAAITDIISVIKRRSYGNSIIIRNTKVQGIDCDADIKQAIADLNRYKKLDLIIITRGGGSIEDLWGFNSEKVIEGVFDSKIPIISAIGHQRDTTLCDFVADKIAPTPTAAAEIITQDKKKIRNNLSQLSKNLNRLKQNIIQKVKHNIDNYQNRYFLKSPAIDINKEYTINNRFLNQIINSKIQMERHKLKSFDISKFSTIFYEDKEITSVKDAKNLEGKISTLIFEDGSIDVMFSNITDSMIIVDKKKKKKKQQNKLDLFQKELDKIKKISKNKEYKSISIEKGNFIKKILNKIQKLDIYDSNFLKLYEDVCNELNLYCHIIKDINNYQPKLVDDINEKIYYDSLDKLKSISDFKSSILSNRINYYKKGLKYLLIVEKYLENINNRFVNIEIKVLNANNDKKLKKITEISSTIDNMLNDNDIIDENFFEIYYKLKCDLMKHQNEIKNSPIEIIELINCNGKLAKKDISTSFL